MALAPGQVRQFIPAGAYFTDEHRLIEIVTVRLDYLTIRDVADGTLGEIGRFQLSEKWRRVHPERR